MKKIIGVLVLVGYVLLACVSILLAYESIWLFFIFCVLYLAVTLYVLIIKNKENGSNYHHKRPV